MPAPSRWSRLVDLALAAAVSVGWSLALGNALIAASDLLRTVGLGALVCCAVVALAGTVAGFRHLRRGDRRGFRAALEALVLVALPLWGLGLSHSERATCETNECSAGMVAFRPLAEPEVWGLLALHAVTVLLYAVSRRRPTALRPGPEALVNGGLLAGLALQTTLALHFGSWLLGGVVMFPVALPAASPIFAIGLFATALYRRLRERGAAVLPPPTSPALTDYRTHADGPAQPPAGRRPLAGVLARAAGAGTALVGLHAVLQGLWLRSPTGALQVFTRTCDYQLSRIPVVIHPAQGDCHYLCTVAAQGHPWLVRPARLGRRRGHAIVVNRQLAVANAFEDLLHTRWPRFGGLCRRLYDRLGLPVSRYIRTRWLADLVYLAMKPLEWGFYLALLLLDPGDPEGRIDQMYR